jgi:threonine synthase
MATAIRIGDPVSFPRARAALEATRGLTTSASEDELATAMRALDADGLFACPHTAAAYAGARQLARAGVIKKAHTVVVVSTASGLKFAEAKSAVAPPPLSARADVRAVMRVLDEQLERAA